MGPSTKDDCMSPDTTRLVATGLALVAVVPVVLFLLDRSAEIVALSLVCVGLIALSLYLMLGPAEKVPTEHGH